MPDDRLNKLGVINNSIKTVPASVSNQYLPSFEELSIFSTSLKCFYQQIEFVDIAGIVKGASEGAGLGNKFLTNIRQTDAIVHVVRCFEDEEIIHVDGNVDPLRDVEIISLELILADLAQIEKKLEKVSSNIYIGNRMFTVRATICNDHFKSSSNLYLHAIYFRAIVNRSSPVY